MFSTYATNTQKGSNMGGQPKYYAGIMMSLGVSMAYELNGSISLSLTNS